MLASAFHTILNGWDLVLGLAAVVVAALLDAVLGPDTTRPRVFSYSILFAVVLFGAALTIRW